MTCPWEPPDHAETRGSWQRPDDCERERLLDSYEEAVGVRPERVGVRDVVMSDGTTWREGGFR